MYSIGDRLKDARISKGLRKEDIEKRTNIRTRYVKAIEEDRLEVLPGESYARTFVKLYADEVGFDGEQIAREFEGENRDFFKRQALKNKKKKKQSRFNLRENGNWAMVYDSLPMIIVIILFLAIIVTIYIASSAINSKPEEPYINADPEESTTIEKDESSLLNEPFDRLVFLLENDSEYKNELALTSFFDEQQLRHFDRINLT